MPMSMNFCTEGGEKLQLRYHESEGKELPYCPRCGAFRYPVFNTAVSMIVLSRDKSRLILIQQYSKPWNVLCAGYVNQGEDAEDAVAREVREELGLTVETLRFNHSRYYPRTNTLMLNFTVTVAEEDPHPNWEVDAWRWFTPEEARAGIKPGSLAAAFLNGYLDGGVYDFTGC